MKLSIDYHNADLSIRLKFLVKNSIRVCTISTMLSLILFSNILNRNSKLAIALYSLIFSGLTLVKIDDSYEKNLVKIYTDTSKELYKNQLATEIVIAKSKSEIDSGIEFVDNLNIDIPQNIATSQAQKYGFLGFLNSHKNSENKLENSSKINENFTIDESIYDENSIPIESDLWVEKLLFQSCFIAGKKGSGKSHLMRYLAAKTLVECNADKDLIYIVDPHYDSDTPWFLGLNEAKLVENGRISKNGISTILSLSKTLENRIENGLKLSKTNSRIVVFIDEIDSYSKKELTDVITPFIKQIEYEGRKYGFSIIIGSHTIKKCNLQLDSSVLASMNSIFFGNILLDRNNVFSGVLPPISEIKSEIEYYKNTFKQSRIVGTVINDVFNITHIPDLSLPTFEVANNKKTTDNDLISVAKSWYMDCVKNNITPTDKEVKDFWCKISGENLTDNGLKLLWHKIK